MTDSLTNMPPHDPSNERLRERVLEAFHVDFVLSGIVHDEGADRRRILAAALQDAVADYLEEAGDDQPHWGPWEPIHLDE